MSIQLLSQLGSDPVGRAGLRQRRQHLRWRHKHLWGEGPVEAIRYRVLQFDPGQRTCVDSLCVQHNKLGGVGLRDVELD